MSEYTDFLGKQGFHFFVVQNITAKKCIKVFNAPIEPGDVRDLMALPDVTGVSIYENLIGGDLLRKILAKEIKIIASNINLLEFSDSGRQFLIDAGITEGVLIGMDELDAEVQAKLNAAAGQITTLHEAIIPSGTKDGVNRTFMTPGKFLNGPYLSNDFAISIYHNGRKLVPAVDYIVLESVPSAGFDTFVLLTFAPVASSILICSYYSKI